MDALGNRRAAVYWAWRRYRRTILSRVAGKLRLEIEHTNQEKRADPRAWAELSPTPQMVKLQRQIDQCHAESKELEIRARGSFMVRRKRQELLRRAKQLEAQLARTDLERRLDLRDDSGSPAPQGLWGKVGRMLVSQGLVSDLKGTAKILSRGATACLAIALVGVSTSQLSAIVRQRLIHLDQLRVLAEVREVNQTWEKGVINPPSSSTQASASDVQAAHQLADVLGRALARNPGWDNVRPISDGGRAELRREATIYEIRHRVRLPDQGAVIQASGGNDLGNLSGTERGAFGAIRSESGPSSGSKIGEAFARQRANDIVSWFGGSWNRVKSDLKQHAALYNEPLKFGDVRDGIVDQIVGSAFGPFTPTNNEFEKLIYEALHAANESIVEQAADTELKKAFIALKKGKLLDHVTHALSTERLPLPPAASEKMAAALKADPAIPTDRELAEKLSQAPHAPAYGGPNGGASGPSVEADAREVLDAEGEAGQLGRSEAETSVDALADYDYYFPATRGDASGSTFTQFLDSFRETAEDVSLVPSTTFRVERALDYAMVRGFSRVGGVVIGREPANTSRTLNFTGLRWKQSGRSVTLYLRRQNGKEVALGTFDQSLIHQALAYAADGRVLTCTMVEAKPLKELKILLNPVLVDTPLGCRVINLDRWVDTYFRDQPDHRNESDEIAEKRIDSQKQLYYVAWGARYLTLARQVLKIAEEKQASGDPNAATRVAALKSRMDQVESKMNSREVTQAAEAGLAQRKDLPDKAKSLLAAKPEFYDPKLVDWIEACSTRKPQLGPFTDCISRSADEALPGLREDDLGRWIALPPSFLIWSGVREQAYSMTDDLSSLVGPQGTGGGESVLWPFDFMLQVSFTSAPAFAPSGIKPSEYVDRNPWDFPELHAAINRRIAQVVEEDPALSDHLKEMREFVVLQRLFRVALMGRLGPNFPVEELATLTSATAGGIPLCHTPRWNPRPGMLEADFLIDMDDVDHYLRGHTNATDKSAREWLPHAVSDLRMCEALTGPPDRYIMEGPGGQIKSVHVNPRFALIPVQQWNHECRFDRIEQLASPTCEPGQDSTGCRMLELATFSEITAAARALRASLHVDEDGATPDVCPPLAGTTIATVGGR